jgi:hypothetical protein
MKVSSFTFITPVSPIFYQSISSLQHLTFLIPYTLYTKPTAHNNNNNATIENGKYTPREDSVLPTWVYDPNAKIMALMNNKL